MSRSNKLLITLLGVCWFGLLHAQNAFTLKEAQDFAVKNHVNTLNAQVDYDNAVAQKNQIRGIGLPQITASVDYRFNQRTVFNSLIKKQLDDAYEEFTAGFPNSGISRERFETLSSTASNYYINNDTILNSKLTQDLNPIEIGLIKEAASGGGGFTQIFTTAFNAKSQTTLNISASQILFSSDYLVALQTSQVFLGLAKMNITMAEIQVKIAVAKSYYNVLVSRERAKLLQINIEKLKKLLEDSRAYQKEGFVENIDVMRLEVNYNNLVTENKKVQNLLTLGEAALKFSMGYDITTPITLKDSIQNIESPELAQPGKANYKNRIEYSLLESQLKMNELNLKRYQYSPLPTVAAYAQNGWNQYGSDAFFYRQTVFGVNMNIPIFSGGQKKYYTQMAKLSIQKTKNNIKNAESGFDMEFNAAVVAYNNSIESLQSQKKNMELADEVFKVTQVKYQNGVGSNLELVNAQQSLRESQANYIEALYNFYSAKLDLDKAQGNIK
jgi:outer membrane protein TolC